jgi:hypothetical protein
MKKELFNDLVASIKEAGKIHRSELRDSREFIFDPESQPESSNHRDAEDTEKISVLSESL